MPASLGSSRYSARQVAVIGGGVIGLSCALALRSRAAQVTVFDSGVSAPGASSRAAGMLGFGFESASDPSGAKLSALTFRAMELWPKFAADLVSIAGASIGYRPTGALCVEQDDTSPSWLSELAARCHDLGLPAEFRSPKDLEIIAPYLAPGQKRSLSMPQDGAVDPPALMASLATACMRDGIGLRVGQPIGAVRYSKSGVEIGGETFDSIVLASGAAPTPAFQDAAGRLLNIGSPSIIPVKGQMLAVSSRDLCIDQTIHGHGVYIVPQGERILIGATVEPGRDDYRVEASAIDDLLAKAVAIVPALAAASRLDAWAGVRPGSPDGLPLIGEAWLPGVFLAIGHYRHGIRLAPGTADAIAGLVLDGDTAPTIAALSPRRFDNRAAESHSL